MKNLDCPKGHGAMGRKILKKDITFKGVDLALETDAYVCLVCGLEAGTIETAGATQQRIADAYRAKKRLWTGEEIRTLRKDEKDVKMNLFVYGTLMIPEIWHRIAGEDNTRDKALLDGFFRSKLNGEVYPGIYEKNGSSVDGMVYYDVSPCAIKKLDLFEGEKYRRIKVTVIVDGKSVASETYALSANFRRLATDEEWNFEEFIRSGNEHFKNNYIGFKNVEGLHSRIFPSSCHRPRSAPNK